MITADEAYKESLNKLEEIETIDDFLKIEAKIKENMARGSFVVQSDPMTPEKGEKLAIELEEFGYNTNVQFSGIYTEEKKPLVSILINWRYVPSQQSRVKQTESY